MVIINGEPLDLAGTTLEQYLMTQAYPPGRIAAERNGAIVPHSQYAQTVLQDGDCLEIVRFVGGG